MNLNEFEAKEMEEDKRIRARDLTMIAYSGYFGLLLSSTFCCYYYPSCRPPTGAAMLALMFAKIASVKGIIHRDNKMKQQKENSLFFFYLPFYGGYCLLNLYQWYKNQK